jgi:hypothetical protein
MQPLRRLGPWAVLAIAVLALPGCASMNVSSYVERGMDVTTYRTYSWGPADLIWTGDPRLDNNRFFDERVRAKVDGLLARRGFERRASGTSDLLLHYHASIGQKIDTSALDRPFGACEVEDCHPDVYDAGTLLIDLVDARSHKLVWRGWAEGSLEGVINNQRWMEDKVDEAVTRILDRLPGAL